jgi:G3E family GTPase
MKLVCTEVVAGEENEPETAAERVFSWFSHDSERVAPGARIEPGAQVWELDLNAQGSMRFELSVSKAGRYWLFTQHLPSEFELQVVTAEGETLNAGSERDFAPGHEHDDRVGSFALETDKPLDPVRFQSWMSSVLKDHGTRLYRMKGFLNISGTSERIVIQGVHMLVDTSSLGPWREAQRRSQLVFIGRELDKDLLADGFHACCA